MRKITLLFFSVLLVISLTSCKKEPAPIVMNFSADFTAQCNGVEIQGNVVVNENDMLSLSLTQPESMKGYTYTFKDSKFTMEYDGMKVEAETNYLPQTAFPSVIYNVLRSLKKENNCYFDTANELFADFKGSCDAGEYTITTQYSMGTISEIKIPSLDFSVKFKAMKIIS